MSRYPYGLSALCIALAQAIDGPRWVLEPSLYSQLHVQVKELHMSAIERRISRVILALASTALVSAQQNLLLSGSIANPTGEEGSIRAWGGYFGTGADDFATGTVARDGRFSLELPAPLPPEDLQAATLSHLCSDSGAGVSLTPAEFPHARVLFLFAFEQATPVAAILASSAEAVMRLTATPPTPQAGDFLVYLLYVPSDVSIHGECLGLNGLPLAFAIDAGAGWNYVEQRVSGLRAWSGGPFRNR
jgi:hypothetical protein